MTNEDKIREKYQLLAPELNERTLRLFASAEAKVIGRGGISLVSRSIEITRDRISRGIKELEANERLELGRIRRKGGGRKKGTDSDPTLKNDLEELISPYTRGDPESPLRWTCKSVRKLASELNINGHQTSHRMVAELLREMNYSLQANRKTIEGMQHPDRDAQFRYINQLVKKFQKKDEPVISVDTKKKELVGNFKNNDKNWRFKGVPEELLGYDFMDKEINKVAPYGVYDLMRNEGWVSVGIDHGTAAFSVAAIKRWWKKTGNRAYPEANHLLITADSGGSNGNRNRLWKIELQKFSDQTGMTISVCHFPPGTSKWNKIEHRWFSFIGKNWSGKPLINQAAIVSLIGSTKTKSGLRIKCELDTDSYPKGIKISDDEIKNVRIKRHKFHGDWNFTISPKSK